MYDADASARYRARHPKRAKANKRACDARLVQLGYGSYVAMNQRCHYTKAKSFPEYGARGIQVCERWRSKRDGSGWRNFLADMGPRPSPQHTIDRYPNRQGNYEPNNCRWATRLEQSLNRDLKLSATPTAIRLRARYAAKREETSCCLT